jgi:MYXO-CTERM domain-containing protein
MLRPLMFAGLLVAAAAGVAHGAGTNLDPCNNDIDCAATPECGGEVCDYPSGMHCKPAGTGTKGMDGWCTHDSDCKCYAQGARCNSNLFYCSFTKASDAPASGGGGASGGTAGTAGTSGTAGSSAGGSTGTAGAGTAGGGPGPKTSSSGGCSVAGAGSGGLALFGLALVAGGLTRRRRR